MSLDRRSFRHCHCDGILWTMTSDWSIPPPNYFYYYLDASSHLLAPRPFHLAEACTCWVRACRDLWWAFCPADRALNCSRCSHLWVSKSLGIVLWAVTSNAPTRSCLESFWWNWLALLHLTWSAWRYLHATQRPVFSDRAGEASAPVPASQTTRSGFVGRSSRAAWCQANDWASYPLSPASDTSTMLNLWRIYCDFDSNTRSTSLWRFRNLRSGSACAGESYSPSLQCRTCRGLSHLTWKVS